MKLSELREARIKMGAKSTKTQIGKMAKHAKAGDVLSALQPDGHTFHSVTVKRVGDKGITVHNHHTDEEDWYEPKHLYGSQPYSKSISGE